MSAGMKKSGSRRSSSSAIGSMSPVPSNNPVAEAMQRISPVLADIAHRDKDHQARAVLDLKRQVLAVSKRLPGDALLEFYKQLRGDICNNLMSKNKFENLGAITTIVELIQLEGILLNTDVNLSMFGRNLLNVLPPFGNDRDVVVAACTALGELAAHLTSPTMAQRFVSRHAEKALEWLEHSTVRNDLKRFAAALILEVLVKRRPIEFAQHIPRTFESIFKVIHDQKLLLRETGVNVLKQCLLVWRGRGLYPGIYRDIEVGFTTSKEEMVHGSVLAASAFVNHTGDYINDTHYFQSVCDSTVVHFETRKEVVQTALIQLIPQLARVQRGVFLTYKVQSDDKSLPYYKVAIDFIIRGLRKDKFRQTAIEAIGDLAAELKQNMAAYLEQIIPDLRNALDKKFQKGKYFCEDLVYAACRCIAKLVEGLGEAFQAQASILLEPLFEAGLSTPLVKTLQSIANCVPDLDAVVQRRTLDVLSLILQNQHFQHPGYSKSQVQDGRERKTPGIGAPELPLPGRADLVLQGTDEVAAKVLALRTLRTFDFKLHSLTKFAQDCIAPMMFHEDPEVREAACVTTAAILVRPSTKRVDVSKVSAVILQLLTAGISDRKSKIRCAVINSLAPHLEPFLAKVEVLKMLFVCLYDNNIETRLAAVKCVGKLCNRNPAYVMPALSKLLVQLLNDLTVCVGTKTEMTSMQLLIELINSAPRVIQPYVDAVIAALRSKLVDTDAVVFPMALLGMGELARVDEDSIVEEVPALMQIILEVLKEQSLESQKEAAVRVLGQITRSTGYVIQPYADFPTLMATLFTVLEEANTRSLRIECIKVFGILGALDPYQEKVNRLANQRGVSDELRVQPENSKAAARGQQNDSASSHHAVGSEEYFMDLVVSELMAIAYDSSLIHIHVHVIRSCGILVVKAGVKFIPYLPQMVPAFIHMIKSCDDTERHALINELAKIVEVFGVHLRAYIYDVIDLIIQYWLPFKEGKYHASPPRMHNVIMGLIRSLTNALGVELKPYIPRLLKHCMGIFQDGKVSDFDPIYQVLEAIKALVALLGELLPSAATCTINVVKDYNDTPLAVRSAAVDTLQAMATETRLGLQSTSLLVALCGVIKYDTDMRDKVFKLLMTLVEGMGDDYVKFGHQRMVESMMNEVLSPEHLAEYSKVVQRTLSGSRVVGNKSSKRGLPLTTVQESVSQGESNLTTQVYIINLAKQASGVSSAFELDSEDWMNRLIKMTYKESQSTAIAACQGLAEAHAPFARKVFKAAFTSCWVVLDDAARAQLVEGLERAMQHNKVFMQLMLNVAEFMSHYSTPIAALFPQPVLGRMNLQCHTYAKALRYKETEFSGEFNIALLHAGQRTKAVKASSELLVLIEDMIKVNQSLQAPEAARGIMAFVRTNMEEVLSADSQPAEEIIPPSWYEKLDEWDKALEAYEKRLEINPQDFEMALGRMRCLDNLGKWQELHDLVEGAWPHATNEQRQKAAQMACSAAAGLGVWEAIETYLTAIPTEDVDHSLYGAMMAIYNNDFYKADDFIGQARDRLEPTLISLWQESYSRGHTNMVKVQMLAELDEISTYKQTEDEAVQISIRRTWSKRLLGCQYNIDVWLPILKVRSLVLQPEDDVDVWLSYCGLCRKQGEAVGSKALGLERSHINLVQLLGCDPSAQPQYALPTTLPRVTYAYIKWMWVNSQTDEAIQHLYHLIDVLSNDQQEENQNEQLLARCYHKLGQWRAQPFLESAGQMSSEITDETINGILESFHFATLYDRSWYKAWHAWAFMSYEAVTYYEHSDQLQQRLTHAIMAITGFFNSIGLCESSNLQDTLRLLTLWFRYGGFQEVASTIAAGVNSVLIDTWVQVIPQLIARIQVADPKLRESIHDILVQVGRCHPQALVFPLTVASHNHTLDKRREAAELLLNKISEHSPELVNQALMVSKELIRVAILWSELWFEGLDEAGRHYSERNFDAMFAVLQPLHMKLNDIGAAATISESEFIDAYGTDLREAWEKCLKYKKYSNRKDLESAWDHYHQVYRMISRSLPMLTSLDLCGVSPKLQDARDLQLVIPGTYLHSAEPVYIQSFASRLTVINSKQRPRRIGLKGTNGKNYQYLLKAHEDLRQDERVMQLFSLVNTLLSSHPTTAKRLLEIKTYFVMPLSPKLGLIEWVPTCDTLHGLVRNHRERNGIVLNQEVRLMLQMTPDYDMLSIIQKIEVFRNALSEMAGDDIARVMWLQSANAESWLERRTTYTRTLAVMSMVGYILGLGDRHPSNLMLDRITGSIMHVDFGDCFEVAMNRAKYPEKVPFRLTRMLVKAMEVCGIEGTFRITCEKVMMVMRSNADSVIAVLEAFVHDPLIDWFRQDDDASPDRTASSGSSRLAYLDDAADAASDRQSDAGSTLSDDSGRPTAGRNADEENSRAVEVLSRVKDKLTGKDFQNDERLDVPSQVRRLIKNATAHENLCQHYTGWCSFW